MRYGWEICDAVQLHTGNTADIAWIEYSRYSDLEATLSVTAYNLQNSISSHTHRPGVVWRTVRDSAIFELNTGYLGDPEAKGLTYTPTKTVDWVQAFGVLDADGPRNVII